MNDLRFAVRQLLKNPGFTAVGVLTLALGIGANTVIFSLVNAVLLQPLPYHQPERLVTLWHSYPKLNLKQAPLSPYAFFNYRQNTQSFADLAAATWWSANVTGDNQPEQVMGMKATANFFSLLALQPARGRAFLPGEDVPGAHRVVVLSDSFWRRRFGADPAVMGRKLTLDGTQHEIIGVAPPQFRFFQNFDFWSPLAFTPAEKQEQGENLLVVGRLQPGVTLAQAQSEMDAIARPIREQEPFLIQNNWSIRVVSLKEIFSVVIRPILFVLSGVVAIILLIACTNLANLLLARGITRRKEMAVRASFGASRWRLIRQTLTESLLLAVLGGAVGLLIASWATDAVKGMVPATLAQFIGGWEQVAIDGRVLAFTSAASLLTGVLFGVLPAWQLSHGQLNEALKEGGRGTSEGLHRNRLRGWFVVSEVALAMMLLVGAGLFLKSLSRVLQVDAGFDPDNLLSLNISLPKAKYDSAERKVRFFQQILQRVETLPGAMSAGLVSSLPWSAGISAATFKIEGRENDVQAIHAAPAAVSPAYFRTMAIPLVAGRFFTDQDTVNSLPVAIIDERLARRHWPDGNPLGKRIAFAFEGTASQPIWREVVGVVGHVKILGPASEGKEQYYCPFAQFTPDQMSLVVRTAGQPVLLANAVRTQVFALDRDQPLSDVQTMRQRLDLLLVRHRSPALLMGAFAMLALLLAITGLYGVIAYSINQRTHEFGIRMALGAQRADVLRLVLKQGMRLVLLGIVLGAAGTLAVAGLLRTLLFDTRPNDPLTFIVIAILLGSVALLACIIPARRATRIDPMEALRYE